MTANGKLKLIIKALETSDMAKGSGKKASRKRYAIWAKTKHDLQLTGVTSSISVCLHSPVGTGKRESVERGATALSFTSRSNVGWGYP